MKKTILVISLLVITSIASAQYSDHVKDSGSLKDTHVSVDSSFEQPALILTFLPKKYRYYGNSAAGVFLPNSSSKYLSNVGLAFAFNVQVQSKKGSFLRLYFDLSTLRYSHENVNVNNIKSAVSYKLSTSSMGADFGYAFPKKKLGAYVYGGLGMSLMEVPYVEGGNGNNTVNFGTTYKGFFQYRFGAGVDYDIFKSITIYLETQYSATAFTPVLDNRPLQGINLLLGIKTPL